MDAVHSDLKKYYYSDKIHKTDGNYELHKRSDRNVHKKVVPLVSCCGVPEKMSYQVILQLSTTNYLELDQSQVTFIIGTLSLSIKPIK